MKRWIWVSYFIRSDNINTPLTYGFAMCNFGELYGLDYRKRKFLPHCAGLFGFNNVCLCTVGIFNIKVV